MPTLVFLPDNGCIDVDDLGERGARYLTLPIIMPDSAVVIHRDGKPVAISVQGEMAGSIRPADLQTVLKGMEEFNDDRAAREDRL